MSAAKTKRLRAALYARFSTEKQSESSITDQLRICQRIADREGFTVVETFKDAAISGGTTKRPGYLELLKAARNHDIDVIVAEDSSRLWRELAEQWRALKELQDLGVHVVGHGLDTRREESKMLLAVSGAAADAYRDEISRRTRRALEGKAMAGKPAGGKAYGYRMVNKARVIDEQQAEIVLQIYKWRAVGWSGQRIARQLNVDGVQPPGASWNRTSTAATRKNPAKSWRPSCLVGDPARGVGILNNPLYKGHIVWGRSRWKRGASDSSIRFVTKVDRSDWIEHKDPSLQIVPDDLWNKVHAIQTATNAHRLAIRKALQRSRGAGKGSKYWLGSLLVCGECGANYVGDGRTDYICPTYEHGPGSKCPNDLRFRREDAHAAVLALLNKHLLSDEQIKRGMAGVEARLKEEKRQEDRAAKAAESGTDFKRLDAEAAKLRGLGLRPTVLASALAEIEQERAALVAKANGKHDKKEGRARQLLARMPELAKIYRTKVERALLVVAKPEHVEDARESTRRLLRDGRITLSPNATHTGVTGPVDLKSLGEHVLELAGLQRRVQLAARKLSGSGGLLPTNSTAVVHFPNIDRRKIRPDEIPSHCGGGHPLTPDNLRIERGERRWRCLQCGRERAAAFRRRRRRGGEPS
jgi:site-specific DNA recombinase